jgi:DNA-binding NtrC family response regulator
MTQADKGARALTVLLIEDERSVLDFMRMALERCGYLCTAANSAAEGMRLLESHDFCGIISDMRMPGGAGGADVHEWIVAHRPQLKGRLLFITGDTVNEDTMRALVRTGVPYIEKPFRVQDLVSRAKSMFGKPE